MKVDIHSHLLPGVDDGAADLEETRGALSALLRGGVTHLALTPHFYPYRQSVSRFVEKRSRAMEQLLTLPEAEKMTLTQGAEVYLSSTLFNAEDLKPLCYEGTEYMLVEPEYSRTFTKETERRLKKIVCDYGITPVIAHINRYPFFLSDPALLARLKEMGCLFQVNISAFSSFFKRRKLFSLYREGFVDFLGGDVHSKAPTEKETASLLSRIEKKEPKLVQEADERALGLLFSSGAMSRL